MNLHAVDGSPIVVDGKYKLRNGQIITVISIEDLGGSFRIKYSTLNTGKWLYIFTRDGLFSGAGGDHAFDIMSSEKPSFNNIQSITSALAYINTRAGELARV